MILSSAQGVLMLTLGADVYDVRGRFAGDRGRPAAVAREQALD
jgi:hypothetical protein